MITLLAFITMFIDHVGLIFFPGEDIWRIIGRIAFPLFAWGIVRGYRMTSNKENYAKRIFLLAALSQVPVLFLFGDELYNVCFTLLFGLIGLFVLDQKKLHPFFQYSLIGCLLIIASIFHFDYGTYGILTILLIDRFWQQKKSVVYFSILTFFYYCVDYTVLTFHFSIQLYAIFSFVLLYFTSLQQYDFKINRYVKYFFYPGHLALLYLIHLYW